MVNKELHNVFTYFSALTESVGIWLTALFQGEPLQDYCENHFRHIWTKLLEFGQCPYCCDWSKPLRKINAAESKF